MMAGTMILANVTGGMQDQMRFIDENNKWIEFDESFSSNNLGKYKKCGEWALPVFPRTISLIGSPLTPYIFDDRCDFRDIATQLRVSYDMGKEERNRRGQLAHEWVTSEESGMSARNMAENIISGIDETFNNFKPQDNFEFIQIENLKSNFIKYPIPEYE